MSFLNYPECIDNECQLNIFMDYAVHTILSDLVCTDAMFYGCETHSARNYVKLEWEVEVKVPIKLPEDKLSIADLIEERLIMICESLIGRRIICNPLIHNIKVNMQVQSVKPTQVDIKLEREENNMFIPEVKEIRHVKSKRGESFTVIWRDETQTTVRLMEGDASDEYLAYLYALGKKLFGNRGEGKKFVKEKKKIFDDRIEKKRKEKEAQRRHQALMQSLASEEIADISDVVYDEMFVTPCLVSRAVFRRNQ